MTAPVSVEALPAVQPRPRKRLLVVIATALLAVGVIATIVVSRQGSPSRYRIIAQTVATASNEQMVRLESSLVGSSAVANPATGPLSDVSAFHRVGIASIRIDGHRLTVVMLNGASATQREAVRAALASSPLVEAVRSERF